MRLLNLESLISIIKSHHTPERTGTFPKLVEGSSVGANFRESEHGIIRCTIRRAAIGDVLLIDSAGFGHRTAELTLDRLVPQLVDPLRTRFVDEELSIEKPVDGGVQLFLDGGLHLERVGPSWRGKLWILHLNVVQMYLNQQNDNAIFKKEVRACLC